MASLPVTETADELADGEAMSDDELLALLGQHEAQAVGYEPGGNDEISAAQEKAINYYNRIMDDVPAQEGCSKVVDGTVQVVIDNALAAILKPFVSSDETVRFIPRKEEDVELADQATEYVNYVFNTDNHGFLILHDWMKDALLSKLGVVKVWWEDEPRLETVQTVIADELHAEYLRAQPNYLGEEGGIAFHGQEVQDGMVRIENVPPEEFRVSSFSRSVQTAIYAAHVPRNVTRSDLIEMGFDPEIIENLPADTESINDNMVRTARYADENITDSSVTASHSSQDIMALRDEYVRIDYNGDGVAELRRILRVGDVILLNEEIEESPFATLCPIPMPHKIYGLSLADLVIELQKINTVLWRQMLDNLYKSNNPRPVVGRSAHLPDGSTADSLSDNAPGAAIMVDDINGFRFDAVPYTAGASLPMLEVVGNMIEERTGISRAGQGLDSNALRKSGQMTATEMAMIQGGKNARVEMMARIFAETGVKRLFKLILGLVTKHQPRERMIRLRNEWVPVDPRGWPEMDLEVSVGLGIGEKSEQIAQADSVLQTMAELIVSPFAHMVTEKNVYNAVKRKYNAAGIKDVDEYIDEPEEEQVDENGNPVPKPEKPDPEQMKAEAEMALQQAKIQGEQQLAQVRLQIQQQELQAKHELARAQAEFEAQLARDKAQFEADLAEQKLMMEERLAERRMQMAERASEATISKNRPGGDLDK